MPPGKYFRIVRRFALFSYLVRKRARMKRQLDIRMDGTATYIRVGIELRLRRLDEFSVAWEQKTGWVALDSSLNRPHHLPADAKARPMPSGRGTNFGRRWSPPAGYYLDPGSRTHSSRRRSAGVR